MIMTTASNALCRNPATRGLIYHRPSALNLNRCVLGAAGRTFESTAASDNNGAPRRNEDNRRQTALERAKNFPAGAKKLYWDMLRYKNIHDASRTPLNAWTIRSPLPSGAQFVVHDNELRAGRIPRREHEEQRRLKDDVRKMAPIIAVWLLPIVGYIPMIVVVVFPRAALSRQFHNTYEKELFAAIELRQCRGHFHDLAEHVFNSAMINVKKLSITATGEDAAGPILDLMPLYSLFTEDGIANLKLAHIDTYPREHLISLALSNGLYQCYPDFVSRTIARLCPRVWLRTEVTRIAKNVATDDTLLLEEGYERSGCESMTDQEVLDVCLMRGLPVTLPYPELRRVLTNHLIMIKSLRDRLSIMNIWPEGLQLFTLHVSALRSYLFERRIVNRVTKVL